MKTQKTTNYKVRAAIKAGTDPEACDCYTELLNPAHKECERGDCWLLASLITYIPEACKNVIPPPLHCS